MSDWQSIETAPKNGTPILLWIGHRLIEAKWEDTWWNEDRTGAWAARWAEIDSYGVVIDEDPTHWMPVPRAPQ
jgi:hypothetical protein